MEPDSVVEIPYVKPFEPLDENDPRHERNIERWAQLHATSRKALVGAKKIVNLNEAFDAFFPMVKSPDQPISSVRKMKMLCEHALHYINSLAGCEQNKSQSQLDAEESILDLISNNILITGLRDYTRRNGVRKSILHLEAENPPVGCVYLINPSITVEYALLARYKALKGTAGRSNAKCVWYRVMEMHDQIRLLKTAYVHSHTFQNAQHYAVVRLVPNPSVALRAPPGEIAPLTADITSEHVAKRQRSSGGHSEKSVAVTQQPSRRVINGKPSRVVPTSDKGMGCAFHALQHSLNFQIHGDDASGDGMSMFAKLNAVVQSMEVQKALQAARSGIHPAQGPFSENELALILSIWCCSNGRRYRFGVFVEGIGQRILSANTGCETIWVYHDNGFHWSGIEFVGGSTTAPADMPSTTPAHNGIVISSDCCASSTSNSTEAGDTVRSETTRGHRHTRTQNQLRTANTRSQLFITHSEYNMDQSRDGNGQLGGDPRSSASDRGTPLQHTLDCERCQVLEREHAARERALEERLKSLEKRLEQKKCRHQVLIRCRQELTWQHLRLVQ